MACIPLNLRKVGYIDPIHEPLDGPLYMGSHIHQQYDGSLIKVQPGACWYIYHPMCHLHDAPGPHAYSHFIHLCNDRAN